MNYRGALLITITLVLSAIFFAARRFGAFKERLRKVKEGKAGLLEIPKGIGRLFVTTEFAKQQPPERGYAYFQDFIPNNDSDTRVVVIGGKFAAAEKRMVRKDDFRASRVVNLAIRI